MNAKLMIFDENQNVLKTVNSNEEIKTELNAVGIRFEQWNADREVNASMTHEEIIQSYQTEIDKLVKVEGYQTYDVISLASDNPNKTALREKFLSEHTHSEDEVRFFVDGKGLFTIHKDEKIFAILCEKNDLISVPAMYPHWFDMSENPKFTCLRFFNNQEGWVAKYTGSDIAEKYPRFE